MLDILFLMWYCVITKLMKGVMKMMKTTVEETAGILKRLTPQNQAYFMTLVRVAEIAENGAKNVAFEQARNPTMQTLQLQR